MRKKELQKLPLLTATPKMMKLAAEDFPKRIVAKTYWGTEYVREVTQYGLFLRCYTKNGILKAAIFLPETMRLGGRLPAYELYIHRETADFITYDRCNDKWLDAKLDKINWPQAVSNGKEHWISPKDNDLIKRYLNTEKDGYEGILDYQRFIREEQLEARHRRQTAAWDKDLAQTPDLPKDWDRWVDKVGIPTNYIFYKYVRGGARAGWCTYCGKEVPISKPHHNKTGRCRCCRHEVTFKSEGRTARVLFTPTSTLYLLQRCTDGFMLRKFQGSRRYEKGAYKTPDIRVHEVRRVIYSAQAKPLREYYWGLYKQRNLRWIKGHEYFSYWHPDNTGPGRCYGKTLPTLAVKELRYTGLYETVRAVDILDPEKYLDVMEKLPFMEQLAKAGLYGLVQDCVNHSWMFQDFFANAGSGGLAKQLGIDAQRLKRLRENRGGLAYLKWLRYEKSMQKPLDDRTIHWLCQENITKNNLQFILDRMSIQQAANYVQRQMRETGMSSQEVLTTWKDYLAMATRLKMDTSDAIIYRARKLRQRHDELVEQMRTQELTLEAGRVLEKFPHLEEIFEELRGIYAYGNDKLSVVVPATVEQIFKEGRELHHCVGSNDRYWERIERRESYILFLRRTAEPEKSYYTLEVEPDGTVRQKRTMYDRQDKDIDAVTAFLKEWQKAVSKQLTAKERSLAQASRVLRIEEFTQMQKDGIKVNVGELQGQLLADVLRADLMENPENPENQKEAAPAALPAAA